MWSHESGTTVVDVHYLHCFDFYIYFLLTDTILKNETSIKTNLIEAIYPVRPDNNAQSNVVPNDRKGGVAIGQSVLYTDFPPKEFADSGKPLLGLTPIYTCICLDRSGLRLFRGGGGEHFAFIYVLVYSHAYF